MIYVAVEHIGKGGDIIGLLNAWILKPQLVPGIEAGCVQYHLLQEKHDVKRRL
jgi:hypothetical protein